MTFYVGQKVVCVARQWHGQTDHDGVVFPTCGETYTVNELVTRGGRSGLILEEIRNAAHKWSDGYGEAFFCVTAFRPAVSPKTSIKVFEDIRDRVEKGEPVDA